MTNTQLSLVLVWPGWRVTDIYSQTDISKSLTSGFVKLADLEAPVRHLPDPLDHLLLRLWLPAPELSALIRQTFQKIAAKRESGFRLDKYISGYP